MIVRNAFSLEHNAPGCSGGVSHPVLTGLALRRHHHCRAIAQCNASSAYVITLRKLHAYTVIVC